MDVDPLEFLSGRCGTGMIMILQLAKETGLEEDEVQPQTRSQWLLPQWMLKQCGANPGLSGADPIATIVAGLPGFIAEEIATSMCDLRLPGQCLQLVMLQKRQWRRHSMVCMLCNMLPAFIAEEIATFMCDLPLPDAAKAGW
jgi:hypothetical protein